MCVPSIMAVAAVLAAGPRVAVAAVDRPPGEPARFRVTVTAPDDERIELGYPLDAYRVGLMIADRAGRVAEAAGRRRRTILHHSDRPHWVELPAGRPKVFEVSPAREYPDLPPGRYKAVVSVRYRTQVTEDGWSIGAAVSDPVEFVVPEPPPAPREGEAPPGRPGR